MPLQATSGAASYDAFGGGGAAVEPNYIESVFSTWLYTGNGSTQTITNNINLSGSGGLTWIKSRSAATNHFLFDTTRGVLNEINSNTTDAQASLAASLTAFNTTGFSLGAAAGINVNAATYVSWTFREQSKFFDVVTYTGTGSNTTIAHSLGSVPACIMVKRTDTTGAWQVYHRSLANTEYLVLNDTAAKATGATRWNSTTPTSTVFSLGTDASVNASGGTYVAYLFAHDAGGFGLTGTDNVISCGSYTGNGSTDGPTVTLGYEPQWIMIKPATVNDNWTIVDNIRAMVVGGGSNSKLFPNSTGAETNTTAMSPQSTGFQIRSISAEYNTNAATYIYIAIRRGPMKVPTTGTSVFAPITYTGTNVDNRLVNTGIVTDMTMARIRTASSTGSFYTADRLRGNGSLGTAITDGTNTDPDSFMTPTVGYGNSFSAMNGFGVGNDATRQLNQSSTQQLAHAFRRAPSFFDEVCYTGTGSATTFSHNLQAVPELMIVKNRSATDDWAVYAGDNTDFLLLNTNAATADDNTYWNDTSPTSTVFSVGTNADVNTSADAYVAYLFATCAGVSKVGSYTGNGSSQTINCGFTAGARYILIKRTDTTGNWYVGDSARGIIAGNDPQLALNDTGAENTNRDWIDPDNSGFIVNQQTENVNVLNATYIFLAIA